ncbi:MAG: aldehyde dehydrogenase family protein [Gammaproteobacteria bacterium]|nr:aldehyde dehydrogenase family protein [Gammaproteobacteria bacterium]
MITRRDLLYIDRRQAESALFTKARNASWPVEIATTANPESTSTKTTGINDSPVNDEPHVPFGGGKASGLGRHDGRWSVDSFSETRWVTLGLGGRQLPF